MSTMQTRYGTRQRHRWFWPVFAAVGIALGVAWAAWIAFQDRPVEAIVYGYDVRSDTSTVISIELLRSEPIAVTCTVAALAEDASTVGERTVEIPPADEDRVRVELPVQTERRAVSGVLRTCRPTQ